MKHLAGAWELQSHSTKNIHEFWNSRFRIILISKANLATFIMDMDIGLCKSKILSSSYLYSMNNEKMGFQCVRRTFVWYFALPILNYVYSYRCQFRLNISICNRQNAANFLVADVKTTKITDSFDCTSLVTTSCRYAGRQAIERLYVLCDVNMCRPLPYVNTNKLTCVLDCSISDGATGRTNIKEKLSNNNCLC